MGLINVPDRRIRKPIGMPQLDMENPLNRDIVGYWGMFPYEFGGKVVHDLSRNRNIGIIAGNTVWGGGIFGPALDYDGTSGTVTISASSKVNNLSKISISAWVLPKSEGENARAAIISKRNGPNLENDWDFNIYASGANSLTFQKGFDDPDVVYRNTSDNTIILNQWQHVAATWDGGPLQTGIHIYVNGIEQGYQSGNDVAGSPGDDSTRDIVIGNQMNDANTWDGLISHVVLWNRVLSVSEIALLYRRPF